MANKRDVVGLKDIQQKWLENPLQPVRVFFWQAFPYPLSVLCVFCSAAAAAGNTTTFEMWGLLDGVPLPLWLRALCHCEPQTLLWKHIWTGALKTAKGQQSYFSAVWNLPLRLLAKTLKARGVQSPDHWPIMAWGWISNSLQFVCYNVLYMARNAIYKSPQLRTNAFTCRLVSITRPLNTVKSTEKSSSLVQRCPI